MRLLTSSGRSLSEAYYHTGIYGEQYRQSESAHHGLRGDEHSDDLLAATLAVEAVFYVVLFTLMAGVGWLVYKMAKRRGGSRLRAGDHAYASLDPSKAIGSMPEGVYGCLDDPSSCCMGCLAPQCVAGLNFAESQNRMCTVWDWAWPNQYGVRQAIRQELNMPRDHSTACADCVQATMCGPCVACQHHRYYQRRYQGAVYTPAATDAPLFSAPAVDGFPVREASEYSSLLNTPDLGKGKL